MDDIEEPSAPKMTPEQMNALLEKEGLGVRVRTKPQTDVNNQRVAQMLRTISKQRTITNPEKDRSLSGKARRKARRGSR